MADALLSIVLERLASVVEQQIRDELALVLGVEAEIQSLTDTLRSVRDVLEDAERRQVKEKSVQGWLERLKDMAYQMDDVVNEWSTVILQLQIEGAENASISTKKVSSCIPSPCFCLKQVASRRDIALKIKSIKQQLHVIASERTGFNFVSSRSEERLQRLITTSAIDISEACGRDVDKGTILGHLLGKNCQQKSGLYIVSIVGTGSMDKTTLAQLAYSHTEVKAHFDERIWVCVSDPFEPIRVCRAIVEALQKKPCNLHDLEAVQQEIQTCIAGQKFLLVLDDVCTEDYRLWEQLKNTINCGASRSRVLATTRNESVVMMMRTAYKHPLGELSPEQSWALFHQIAFFEKSREKVEELKAIGEKIADKGKGLPLAIKTSGNLMRLKNNKEDWENILNSEVWQLDEFERDISPALLLSYYDLPPAIKRCFSFCAVFPKDSVIEIDKLIKLWMAQDYLNSNASKEMEMVGREYFEYLAARSFFQDFEKDGDDNIIRCKMHDIVHSFAQFLTKNECCIMNEEGRTKTSFQKIRHATLIGQQRHPNFVSTYKMKNLRTLLLEFAVVSSIDEALPNLFQHLTCLRVLDLARNLSRKELPKAIEKLIHLKYLNLSHCHELRELPEAICDLYNLQTLNIRGCDSLVQLPQAMGKLINLRHLQNFLTILLKGLPKGISRLNSLQTLEKFTVSSDGHNECNIGDLGNLSNLRGELEIRGLQNVENAREAREANLKNKIHIHHLTLVFDPQEGTNYVVGAPRSYSTNLLPEVKKGPKSVVEALQPHPNLKSLCIRGYGDTEWPGWMMRSSLTQLKNLELSCCSDCLCMPPLGELPVLETLEIKGVERVKHIGGEFLRSSSIAFPKLKKLTFRNMKEWEKWEVIEEEKRLIMSCLSYLGIHKCPKLEGLPDRVLQRTPLQELIITKSGILQQRTNNRILERMDKKYLISQ
ncbi:putative disease resistance protein RGA4 [Vitis vinifera]|uniref:Putative disease resistance protein RGA4 n=1 Tax=Vitis vinifera TaxID=29760 RepID=A0A438FXN4_VITVI|nr:putative disease resistance protein RGA4 [Vitis vinifera]